MFHDVLVDGFDERVIAYGLDEDRAVVVSRRRGDVDRGGAAVARRRLPRSCRAGGALESSEGPEITGSHGGTKTRRRNGAEGVACDQPAARAAISTNRARAQTRSPSGLCSHAIRADRWRPASPAAGRTRLLRRVSVAPFLRAKPFSPRSPRPLAIHVRHRGL